jgi:hypothetical protein
MKLLKFLQKTCWVMTVLCLPVMLYGFWQMSQGIAAAQTLAPGAFFVMILSAFLGYWYFEELQSSRTPFQDVDKRSQLRRALSGS